MTRRRLKSGLAGFLCVAIAGGASWSLISRRDIGVKAMGPGEVTASISPADKTVGASGLPVPRFVSLKADKVNVRRGPSSDHRVAWVFQRKGLPVEIVAEFENWRRIRDSDGEEGWVYQSMLSGRRTAAVAPWRKDETVPMYSDEGLKGGLIARVKAGVVGEIDSCGGEWCAFSAGGYKGYVEQAMLWGVYPGETVGR